MALCVRLLVSFRSFFKKSFCRNDQAYNCLILIYSELIWKANIDGTQPLMEDGFDRRQPLTEDDL